MPSPQQVAADVTYQFLRRHLPPPPARILDVGCGPGVVAALLARDGYEVVALDTQAEAVELARGRGIDARRIDWMTFEDDRPFEAVLFVRVLHHLSDLDAAIDRACRHLAPEGRIVVEDFASEATDGATFEWMRTVALLLSRAGLLGAPSDDLLGQMVAAPDPGHIWRTHHLAHLPMHPSSDIAASLARSVDLGEPEVAPYLFRYFAGAVAGDHAGGALLAAIRDAEARAIAVSMIRPIGRRFVGARR